MSRFTGEILPESAARKLGKKKKFSRENTKVGREETPVEATMRGISVPEDRGIRSLRRTPPGRVAAAHAARPRNLVPKPARRRAPASADLGGLRALGVTRGERKVPGWIAHGEPDAEIAALLGIAAGTVGEHVESILRKLRFGTRPAAVAVAGR